TVVAPGINSKMDEMRAAYGLLNLRQVDAAIAARKRVAEKYVEALKDVKGIELFPYEINPTFKWNYSYFPILVTDDYRMTRDALYEFMKTQNVLGRRYFYPLITDFEPYKTYPSADKANLPIANRLASQVICLPMHHALITEDVKRVLECIKSVV
ncbi:MAG TPA: aminotransferase, partial [Prevotellaceae bacterium]|nr:aminotransferase [Prevotellaceae bacterium]